MPAGRPLSHQGKLALAALGAGLWAGARARRRRRSDAGGAPNLPAPAGGGAPPAERVLLKHRQVLWRAARRWNRDGVSRMAAALSFYTAFSIAPLMLIAVAVAGAVLGEQAAHGLVSAALGGFLGDERARAVEQLIMGARRPEAGGLAGLIGFVTLAWAGSRVVGELQASLNIIYGVESPPDGWLGALRRKLISLVFVGALGLLMIASLLFSAAASALGGYFGSTFGVEAQALLVVNQLVSVVTISVAFAGIFRFLPDARVTWGDLCLGSMFSGALFTLGNLALGFYMGRAGVASAYGAAGSLLGFMLWTYYSAQMLYFGAEYTRAYAEGRGRGIRPLLARQRFLSKLGLRASTKALDRTERTAAQVPISGSPN